jgi:hypothetical protein
MWHEKPQKGQDRARRLYLGLAQATQVHGALVARGQVTQKAQTAAARARQIGLQSLANGHCGDSSFDDVAMEPVPISRVVESCNVSEDG